MGSEGRNFKVVIVGGGIAGLSLAHALTLANINYVVLERRESIVETSGAGVGSWPHSIPFLKQIGVYEKLDATCTPLKYTYHLASDGSVITYSNAYEMHKKRYGETSQMYHRTDLLRILYEGLPNYDKKVRTGCKVDSILQDSESATVVLEDGTKETGDIVIGTDGVHSKVREFMWEHARRSQKSGDVEELKTNLTTRFKCLFGISKGSPFEEKNAMIETHSKGHAFHFFTQKEHTIWFLYVRLDQPVVWPDKIEYTEEDAAALAKEYGEDILTKKVKFHELWDTRIRARLAAVEEGVQKRWFSGRVALVGDAAHKMTPILGLGANTAVESITVLVNLLHHRLTSVDGQSLESVISQTEIEQLFSTYQKERYFRASLCSQITGQYNSMATLETSTSKLILYLPRYMFGLFEFLLVRAFIFFSNGAPKGLDL